VAAALKHAILKSGPAARNRYQGSRGSGLGVRLVWGYEFGPSGAQARRG
jgi:hypothetical protein